MSIGKLQGNLPKIHLQEDFNLALHLKNLFDYKILHLEIGFALSNDAKNSKFGKFITRYLFSRTYYRCTVWGHRHANILLISTVCGL